MKAVGMEPRVGSPPSRAGSEEGGVLQPWPPSVVVHVSRTVGPLASLPSWEPSPPRGILQNTVLPSGDAGPGASRLSGEASAAIMGPPLERSGRVSLSCLGIAGPLH